MIVRRYGWAALLAIAALAFSAHFSQRAPCGSWANAIFAEQAWGEADPGSFYFAAAHELAWGESPLFVGHPGAPLLPLLYGVQSALYLVLGDDDSSFTRFIAQHLPTAFLASKLLMTVLHLLSFVAVHGLARQLLRDPRAATLATLGYATCFPVLYFLSRISVEPLMVGFFAAAFWASWRYEDLAREGRLAASLAWVGLAAAAAVSGALSKLAFVGPLPFLLALQIGFGSGRSEPLGPIAWRVRWRALAVFGAVALVTLALYSQIIDWSQFARAWRKIARKPLSDGWELLDLLPGLGSARIYLAAELGFALCAVFGWGMFLRRRPADRRRALWLSAYGAWGLALFLYRVSLEGNFLPFHYSFVPQATAAVFFGYAGVELWRRMGFGWGWRAGLAAAAALILLHGVGFVAVVDARRHDAEKFAVRGPIYPLIAQLEPGERLAVLQQRWKPEMLRERLIHVHGFSFPFMWHPRESLLLNEFESFFSLARRRRVPAGTELTFVPVFGAKVARLPARAVPAP